MTSTPGPGVSGAPGLPGALGISGSVSFAVQDGSRTASGTVRGTGDTVTVEVDRPWVVLRSVRDVGFPQDAGRLLETSGITVDVRGPHGRLALAGPGVHSRLGRLLTGSDHLRPYPGGLLASRMLTRAAVAVGAAAVAFAVIGGRGRRRQRPRR